MCAHTYLYSGKKVKFAIIILAEASVEMRAEVAVFSICEEASFVSSNS